MPVPTELASDSPLGPRESGAARGEADAVGAKGEHGEKDETFPREHRLLRRGEFIRVQQQGRRVHTAHFVMLVIRGRTPGTRLGVTVGRRVGGAVQRNRVKRVVREVFRRNRQLFPRDCDVVLVARPGADRLDYATVIGELERAQTAIERAVRQLRSEPISSSDS